MIDRRAFVFSCAAVPVAAHAQTLSDPNQGRDVVIDISDQPVGYRLGLILEGKPAVFEVLEDGPVFHYATCTFRGCVMYWRSRDAVWGCPCCNTQFRRDGVMISGIGRSDMVPANVSFDGPDMILHNQKGPLQPWTIPES